MSTRWTIGVDKRRVAVYVGLALIAGFAFGFATAKLIASNEKSARLAESRDEAAALAVSAETRSPEFHRVTRILRADTVEVEGVGAVRMIGIETPDGKSPREIYGPHGQSALAFAEKSLLGQEVKLEFDPAYAPRANKDEQGRTLAYLFTRDGALFNSEMVRQGLAFVRVSEPFQSIDDFRKLERDAMQAMRGVWGPGGSPSSAPLISSDGKPAEQAAASGDKSKRITPLLPSEIGPPLSALSGSTASSEPAVYVSAADKMYHKDGCEYLSKKKQAVPLSQAKAEGRTACSRCFASTVLKAP